MQIWRALDNHLCHLLLMMSLDWPLAIRHKNGEYIWMEIGGFLFYLFYFFVFWSFRLDLGASSCTFLAHDVFILMSLFFMSCI